MSMVWIFLTVGGSSWGLTGFLRYYALKKKLIDIPNDRSSHTVPTPRGGGVSIVLVFLLSLVVMGLFGPVSNSFFWAVIGAGTGVALIGFIDDHGHIPARWRLAVHFVCAGWALAWLGGLPVLPLFGFSMDFGVVGYLLAALYLVWLLNLYNFMDGIDGLAGMEAVTVCFGGGVLYALVPGEHGEWLTILWIFSAAVAGFLLWNFPKAKIFMGDAGSGFIGMMLGLFSLQAGWVAAELFWGWVILLGAFVVDATVTLVRRVLGGESFHEAHRCHAYQNASRKYNGHMPVTLGVSLINLCWLLPVAVLVVIGWLDGFLGVIIAYSPLVFLSVHFKAGKQSFT